MEQTPPPSKTSDKNPWPVTEDQSSFRDGSRRWPDWNTRESLKCEDTSEWPSWECSQGNKDIQKGDTMDIEVLASADSSFDEQRGRGRLRELSRDGGWNGSAKRHSEMSKRNSWHVTKDHSSSHNGHSRRWPDCDALNSSKCKDDSGWQSWECFHENKDTHNDDTVDREVHTVSKYTFDEQRGQSKIRKRGRSRSRQREYSKSWSRSPCNGLRQASCRLSEKGSVSEKTSRRCRDFAAGKCSRGSQCRFLHQGYLNSRHRDHTRNEHTDRSNFRADDRGTLQFCDYKGSASGPCDKISDNCEDYCAEVESTKDAVCWKKSLEGKCFREESCRYSHHRSSGEEYDRRNERIVCDQNVKPLVKQNDISHCKFSTIGRCHQNDCRFSHDVGRVTTGFLDAAKTKKCDEDCQSKRWDGRSKGNIYSQDLSEVKNQIDDNILRNSVKKSGKRNDSGSNEKLSERDKLMDLNMPVDREKATGQVKDKTESWNGSRCDKDWSLDRPKAKLSMWGENVKMSENGSTWDKFAGVSERPKDTASRDNWPAWPDSSNANSNSHDPQNKTWDGRSRGNICSQYLLDGTNQADINILYNSVKKSTERADPGRKEKFPEREEFLQSHWRDGAANNTNMDLKMLANKEKAKLSEWGENTKKSENGLAWDTFAGVSERPKDTTSWDNWPDSSNGNSNSHDPQRKRWNCRSEGNIYAQDLRNAKRQADDNILYNSVKKSRERADPERNEKFSEREEFLQSHMRNDAANNTNMDLNMLDNKEKAMGQKKDMTKLWNAPTWSDEGCSIDRLKDTGRDDRTIGNRDPCVFADIEKRTDGNIAHNFGQKDTTKSWNVPTWGDGGCSLDKQNATGRSGRENGNRDPCVFADVEKSNDVNMAHSFVQDMTNSWSGPTWGGEGCSLDRPKATGKGDRATGNRDPRICAHVEERNDGNMSHSFVQKGIQNSSSEWNKKVTVRDANRLSPLQNDYNGAGSNTIKVSDSVKLNDGKKSTNQGEDKKNSWNLKCDNLACFMDNTKASGWGGSRSSDDRHCHDPVDEKKPNQNSLVKTDCKMAISGQDNKVVVKDEYRPTYMLSGREGVDKDTGNLLASKNILYRKENQTEAQGLEPGGLLFPPSSLMGSSQSTRALSPNLSNGFNVILDESVKYKLSALVNQMQNQFEEALKILETGACQNSITADQTLRLSELQACLSENGVHVKSNEVLEKLKMEYLESSATILKQQEPVGYTELNQNTVMVKKVSRNNSKGEQCKKEEEIIQSVGADTRCEAGQSKLDEKSMWLFKNALVKLVKEILNPIWMEGQMKKEAHNTIVKKVVDKVISTEGVNIPRIQEHTEQYLSSSKPQISALINDYVIYFKRLADSS